MNQNYIHPTTSGVDQYSFQKSLLNNSEGEA
jgi:hypothetical protein